MAIPQPHQTNFHQGNTIEDIVTSIDVADFPFLADMLNKLYKDLIMAPIREYATNAWDAHVEAGNRAPIEVTLPTQFSPNLVIRDFGVGMNRDDLANTYSKYARSDKRDKADVAGQLGMGSKSGLSYATSFTITGIKNGERVDAIFTKNEGGLGVIKVLAVNPTTEANGVTITIPVASQDIAAFATKADHLFSFWEPGTVLVNGQPVPLPEWHDSALWLDTERTVCLVPDNALTSSYVVMGNVPYPVPDHREKMKNGYWKTRRFVARLNIGDVDFTPSRETVKDTVRTTETLAELSKYIKVSFDQALAKLLAAAPNAWERTKLNVFWGANGDSLMLRSHGAPIWSYDPNASGYRGNRAAKSHDYYDFNKIIRAPNTIIVTGFTAQNVSADARLRIRDYAPSTCTYLIVPIGTTGVASLDGRANVVRWADIIEATKASKTNGQAGPRGPKVETRYLVKDGNSNHQWTAAEIAKVAEDPNITMLYRDSGTKGMGMCERLFDGKTYIVCLYSSAQLPRIERFVPGIRRMYEELNVRRLAALAALTEADSEHYHLRDELPAILSDLEPTQIDDPKLRYYVTMRTAPFSDTLATALHFGCNIPEPPANRQVPDFTVPYPLIGRMYSYAPQEEVLIYLNARHAVNVAARQAAQIAHANAVAAALAAANAPFVTAEAA